MAEAQLLRGGPIAETVRAEIAAETGRLHDRGIDARLAVVVASDDAAVLKYAEAKGRNAAKLGIDLQVAHTEPAAGQAALEERVAALSHDPAVHGVLLELPVGPGLDAAAAIAHIDPRKDVDGLTPHNLGLIAAGLERQALLPATPAACIDLAGTVGPLAGRRATVVGRGRSVGRALIPMLINRDVTVTVCHTKTPDLAAAIAPADLVFVAAGRAGLITGDHIGAGQVVVDAGINVVDDRIVGDVDRDSVLPKAAALTPVPGGVGPLTTALIFRNLLRAIALLTGGNGR